MAPTHIAPFAPLQPGIRIWGRIMVTVKPFKGLRPKKEHIDKVASAPYDVMDADEAREYVTEKGLRHSFLHVVKPEIDLPGWLSAHHPADYGAVPSIKGLYDPRVYGKGAENLGRLIGDGIMEQDSKPCFYLYRQIMGDHTQFGLIVCASAKEYVDDLVKKHEFTRPDKENDRTNHIKAQGAHCGPVFLTYRKNVDIDAVVDEAAKGEPEYDFTVSPGEGDPSVTVAVQHTVWVLSDPAVVGKLEEGFNAVPALYVADGHHRSASAARVYEEYKAANPNHTGDEEYNHFLAVLFPHDQMKIIDYNRVVKDLNGLTPDEFMDNVKVKFEVEEVGTDPYHPKEPRTYGLYMGGKWYSMKAKEGTWDDADPVGRIDGAVLQANLLAPVLGIDDPRTSNRIAFVGGIRGLGELVSMVDEGKGGESFTAAFAMNPTTIDDVMNVADAGKTMPPKCTWFEPKLRSGLVVHLLD
jgi:uncharacterized protein (DUF1015 family)